MSGVSGSAIADAAAIGPIMIRAMHREGYPRPFELAWIETAATIAAIIPPSIPFIIYAVIANVSIGAMFLAGIVPGVLMALGLAAVVRISATRLNLPRSERADWRAAAKRPGTHLRPCSHRSSSSAAYGPASSPLPKLAQ